VAVQQRKDGIASKGASNDLESSSSPKKPLAPPTPTQANPLAQGSTPATIAATDDGGEGGAAEPSPPSPQSAPPKKSKSLRGLLNFSRVSSTAHWELSSAENLQGAAP